MGLLDFFKRLQRKRQPPTASGFYPRMYANGQMLNMQNWLSYDIIQQAIYRICAEVKKLHPTHIIRSEGESLKVNDKLQSVLDSPNQLMTTADFLERITYQLYTRSNAYILPEWDDNGKLAALYPINPATIEFIIDPAGVLYVTLTFPNAEQFTIRYADLIHIRRHYSQNDFLGGNSCGQPDDRSITQSLTEYDNLIKSIDTNLSASKNITALVKYNSMVDRDKMEKDLDRMLDSLRKGESGILPIDIKAEYIPIPKDIKMVDSETLKFLDSRILCNFSMNRKILDGTATKAELEAWYNAEIEPLIITISQAFTKTLLSERERQGFGHEIIFKHDLTMFISTQDLISALTLLSNTGSTTASEIRSLFGFDPLKTDTTDKLIMSKNFGDAKVVSQMEVKANE